MVRKTISLRDVRGEIRKDVGTAIRLWENGFIKDSNMATDRAIGVLELMETVAKKEYGIFVKRNPCLMELLDLHVEEWNKTLVNDALIELR